MKIRHLLYFCSLLVLCCENAPEETKATPNLFTLLSSNDTGIDFNNIIKDDKDKNIFAYANFYGGAGVGVGDFNNDGLQDIFFAGNMVPDKLYLNKGNLVFEDVTIKAGIKNFDGWSTGVTIADINNDGHLDIYVSRELYDENPEWRRNLVYINNGDGTFTEKAEELSIANTERTRHATFIDFDKDGLLDLFLLTQPPNPGSLSQYHNADNLLIPEYALKLYKNNGTTFKDVSKTAGIDRTGFPNAVSASDINNDGWPDLYVANDFYAPDFLFLNNQDGTFTSIEKNALKQTSYYSMGVDVADINNDQNLDVFVLDMVSEDNFRLKSNMSGMNIGAFWKVVEDGGGYQYMYNTLQLNNGNETFSNIAQFTGMSATDWSWSNLIADFDNDGLKDTYVTNGLLRDIRNTDADKNVAHYINTTRAQWLQNNPNAQNVKSIWDIVDLEKAVSMVPSQPLKNYAYQNLGDLEFKNTSTEWGLDNESFSNGSAYADLDNDGDLDLVVNNINSEAFIYRNNSEAKPNSNYLRIQLVNKNNGPTFGTRVNMYTQNGVQTLETTNVRGIYSTSEPTLHFGLNNLTQVDSLTVVWPNGKSTVKRDISANQLLEISSDESEILEIKKKETEKTLFADMTDVFPAKFKHQENQFDDFEKQILLPHKLSQFGPALTAGDINDDGLDDFYIGGAANQAPTLFIQQKDGNFEESQVAFWQKEAGYEDVDALFVDINNDGLKDLYVVSGGNEYPKNDFHYTDRIYLNQGNATFKKGAILNAKRISGSVVKSADYDGDGDMDLFVGGRHTPQQYPNPSSSMLLVNDNGQLVNQTELLSPQLLQIGMITDAIWSDYDNDQDLDLMIVGEWMPITIFENNNGNLAKVEKENFTSSYGWWFSIEQGDFDNDGDMDYIAGNLGLNYKYKTSSDKPFDVYYNDFDANGNADIVLGYYNKEKHYPLRGFSCSSEQIPALKKKIVKYDAFASMELKDVYGEEKLKNSLHYSADTFASVYIENLGNGQFKITDLPNVAQLSNLNDMLVRDFNGDGALDVLAIGNLYVSEIETPRNDAGTGLLLLGDGTGSFSAKRGSEIGFFADRDAKKLVTLSNVQNDYFLVGNNDDVLQIFELQKN
ncbi:VCBS repeat-containing protein [Maribacter sp. 1_2014MBL_MicDiv]|uniref:VCBS repeat-containing protein n=1 Tax=Maribacter sp. 1_2014MBL_MicDiv TaxID=1644130 RepID=UPI0008F544EC|nr:VCBS repeat-containing protein [Maribacter sp. 1_2014MBL_MicDiv]APA64712.1 lipoprotein [Maribacter sp. 1_2014MBL_MicDiv]